MTKILFVYHVSIVGGGSYCLLNLLKAVDRSSFEPIVLLPQKGPLCDEIKKLGIEIIYYPKLLVYPYNKTLFSFKTLKRIMKLRGSNKGFKRIVMQINPQIVYFNTMMLFPYLKTTKKLGCKTVLHVREHWPLDEHKCQLENARRLVYKYADKLIAINRYSASIFPLKNATIVYDWIDMESRCGGPSLEEFLGEKPEGKTVYLFTGGVDPVKGAVEVLNTFSHNILGDNKRLLALGVNATLNWNGIKGKIKRVLSILGYKTYPEKVLEICKKDKRIVCRQAIYNISDLMKSVDGIVSFFTIPHANLALAESIILKVNSIAANTEEALEYSGNGEWARLYDFGNIEAFCRTWQKFDSCEGASKLNLEKGSMVIKEQFSQIRNSEVFNDVLKSIARDCVKF